MRPISNLNSVSIRNYGPNYETLAVIKELKKLGIIKSVAKAKRQSKPKMTEEVKQPSDMVGYVKTLGGQAEQGRPNLFTLRQIEPGMSQQQIADIEKRNAAGIAILNAEIQQQRLADIEAQQRQRFADISMITGIDNPVLSRFRGAQELGAGQRPSPFIQSTTIQEIEPDVNEGTFTQSLNEGGPKDAPIQPQIELYAEGEEEEELIPTKPALLPREPIKEGGGAVLEELSLSEQIKAQIEKQTKAAKARKVPELTLQQISDAVGIDLGPVPKQNDKVDGIKNYYLRLTEVLEIKPNVNKNKRQFLDEIEKILRNSAQELKY
jgi:hypothetical protein